MKRKIKVFVAILCVVVLTVVLGVVLFTTVFSKKIEYVKRIEMSQKYVDELNYAKAIAELEVAIEIEPNDAKAYLALAEVYIQMDDSESAIAILQEAKEKVNNVGEIESLLFELIKEKEQPKFTYNEDGSYEENIYDEKGKKTKVMFYSSDGILTGYWEYEYDEKGNKIKLTPYSVDGTISGVYEVREYDDMGRVVKACTYWRSGVLWAEHTYAYHDNGKREKDIICSDGIPYMYTITEYDISDKILKTAYYDMQDILDFYVIPEEYDIYGNVLKESSYNIDGTLLRYTEYEYDENGFYVGMRDYDENGNLLSEY